MGDLLEIGRSLTYKTKTVQYNVDEGDCVPFINMHMGRVHDVTHCYNLGEKCVPPY